MTFFYAELSQYAGCAHQTFIISYIDFFIYNIQCFFLICDLVVYRYAVKSLFQLVYFGSFIKFLKDIIS